MAKKLFYMTIDTETATLPFANEICKTAKQKQKVSIAKPLVYDLGWVITDRQGNVVKKENFLIAEIFSVMPVFNTGYYKWKRPLYLELVESGELQIVTWKQATDLLVADMERCDFLTAFNAGFDFKKAIPFTEKYISKVYNSSYYEWEAQQKRKCLALLKGEKGDKNPEYLNPVFKFRGKEYPIVDLWDVACERLINIDKYRNYCLDTCQLTDSGQYFKSGAEACFQYLMKKHDFVEAHTALADALIEAEILTKALKKGKVTPVMANFPFRKLGSAVDYVKTKKKKHKPTVRQALTDYIEKSNGETLALQGNSYWKKVITMRDSL